MSEDYVLIEFVKPWGHPTRNEVYGPPQRVRANTWQAYCLIEGGYAVFVPRTGLDDGPLLPTDKSPARSDRERLDWLDANRLLISRIFRGCDAQLLPRQAIDRAMDAEAKP